MTVFDGPYAGAYDALYGDKDYAGECDVLERIFARFATAPVKTVLDLGCGTGNHAVRLAQRGYEVSGVDRSPAMLAAAAAKAKALGLAIPLHRRDLLDLDLGRQFDAVLMMFAVLGYQTEDAHVLRALASARRHLRPGGLLVFDCWNGPAVLAQRPGDRVKTVPTSGGRIVRAASATLDVERHVCAVRYRLSEFRGDRVVSETDEEHRMRFFFPEEIGRFLGAGGFRLLRLGAFPAIDEPADERAWNALAVAASTSA